MRELMEVIRTFLKTCGSQFTAENIYEIEGVVDQEMYSALDELVKSGEIAPLSQEEHPLSLDIGSRYYHDHMIYEVL